MKTAKKLIAVFVCIALMFTMFSATALAAPSDWSAVEITPIALDSTMSVTITESVREKYFSFTPTVSGYYNLTSYNDNGYDTYAELYEVGNSGIYYITSNDDGSYNGNFSLSYQLNAGTTYYFVARRYSTGFAEFTVKLTEMPTVESLTVDPITIIEGTNGQFVNQGTEDEYYRYSWNYNISYTVVIDGQTISGTGIGLYYNGIWYSASYSDTQWQEHWTVGNTYTATVSVMGQSADVSVTIAESPLESVTFAPISIVEGTNGQFVNQGTEDEHYYYNWYYNIPYTVVIDGQTISGTGNGFDYNGDWYSFSYSDSQWQEHWTVGNTYTVTLSIMGQSSDVSVTITESPVESVTFAPISIIEGTNGYWSGMSGEEYYRYEWCHQMHYTMVIDGQTISGVGSSFEYNGEWHSFTYDDFQWQEHWTVGNTYTVTVNAMGCSADVSVTITESPVESITVEPIFIEEDTNGNLTMGEGPDDRYFYYHWYSQLEFTVVIDGKTIHSMGGSFEYNGEWYGISFSDNQRTEHWYGGNTYTPYFIVFGKRADVSVTILDVLQEDGFKYSLQGDMALITGCSKMEDVLTVPSVVDGKTVFGITSLEYGLSWAKELTIPNTVTMISRDLFKGGYDLEKIVLGDKLTGLNNAMFDNNDNLQEFVVSANNKNYTTIDGVLYDKDVKTLIAFPKGKTGTYRVPDTVTNIDVLFDNLDDYNVLIDFGNSKTGYICVDGVYYNSDMTVVYRCVTDETGTYVMPNTVTTIKDNAFANCNFSEIIISENVTEIVYCAFSYSMELERVVLPENLESIGNGAFRECLGLKDVELPKNLKSIGDNSFMSTNIKNITIPSSLKSIGYSAFSCSALETIKFNEGIEKIDSYAFYSTNISALELPNSLIELGDYAFSYSPIETLKIGSGLTCIGWETFAGTKLLTVTLPKNVEQVSGYAFAWSDIKEVIFENEAIVIGEGSFMDCPIENLDIKDGTVTISDLAFSGGNLKTLTLPDSVTDIAYKSFADNKNLIDIKVSDNLESLGGYAFDGTAWYESQPNGLVYLQNYLYGYKGKMPENAQITIANGTKLIAGYAFNEYHELSGVTIPSSVKAIGEYAFYNCTGLTNIFIPSSVETIGYNAFSNCDNLAQVTFGSGMASIDGWCFEATNNLKQITIPKSVEYIGCGAFSGCYNITDVYYEGSERDRNNMGIEWGNEYLEAATWHYNCTPEEPLHITVKNVSVEIGDNSKTINVSVSKEYFDMLNNTFVEFIVNGNTTTVNDYADQGNYVVYSFVSNNDCDVKILLNGRTDQGAQAISDAVICQLSRYQGESGQKFAQFMDENLGDANDDGVTNVKDLVRLKKIIAELEDANKGADINGNGNVTMVDLTRLAKLLTMGKKGILAHTVTFVDDDGTVLETIMVPDGFKAQPTVTPSKPGHVFDEWDKKLSNITSDQIITACYE